MTTTSVTNLTDRAAAPPQPSAAISRRAWVWLGAFTALVVAYHFAFLARTWMFATTDNNWSHALLIPLIGAYYIYQHRDRLLAAEVRIGWWGLPILFFGLFGYAFGIYPVRNDMAQGYSMIAAIFGLTLLLLGPQAMRVLWFPIAFLAFGVKISDRIWSQIAWQLQQLAAEGATILLKFFTAVINFDVEKRGNTIDLFLMRGGQWTEESLNIAEACSGLRMLMAFIALATVVAFLWPRAWWQRAAIIAMAVPIAVFVNVLRVTTLGLLALVDTDLIHGSLHTYIGMAMLLPAAGLFWLLGWVLERIVIEEPDQGNKPDQSAKPRGESANPAGSAAHTAAHTHPDENAPTPRRAGRTVLGVGVGILVTLIAGAVYYGMISTDVPAISLPYVPDLWARAAVQLVWTLGPTAIVGGGLALLALKALRGKAHTTPQPTLLTYGFVAGALLTVIIGQSAALAATRAVLIKQPVPLRSQLPMVPSDVGPWVVERHDPPLTGELLQALGTDQYISRIYRDTSWPDDKPGKMARLHVAYYTGTPDTVPHVPERCFVAAGLEPIGKDNADVTLDTPGMQPTDGKYPGFTAPTKLGPEIHLPERTINTTRFVFAHPDNPEQTQNVFYFFAANGKFLANPDLVRLEGFEPTDKYSYYCKVEVQLFGINDPDKARQRAESLLSHVLPEIMACLPDWRDVKTGDWPTPEAARRAERSGS